MDWWIVGHLMTLYEGQLLLCSVGHMRALSCSVNLNGVVPYSEVNLLLPTFSWRSHGKPWKILIIVTSVLVEIRTEHVLNTGKSVTGWTSVFGGLETKVWALSKEGFEVFTAVVMRSINFWDMPATCLLDGLLNCSSTLKMEPIRSSETSGVTQRTTRRHIPEDDTLH
jgi:hypothetical protein